MKYANIEYDFYDGDHGIHRRIEEIEQADELDIFNYVVARTIDATGLSTYTELRRSLFAQVKDDIK